MTAHTWQFICQRAGLWAGLERGFGTNHWSAIAVANIDPGYRMRNKLLNEHLFDNLRHVRNLAVEWRTAFNHQSPFQPDRPDARGLCWLVKGRPNLNGACL